MTPAAAAAPQPPSGFEDLAQAIPPSSYETKLPPFPPPPGFSPAPPGSGAVGDVEDSAWEPLVPPPPGFEELAGAGGPSSAPIARDEHVPPPTLPPPPPRDVPELWNPSAPKDLGREVPRETMVTPDFFARTRGTKKR